MGSVLSRMAATASCQLNQNIMASAPTNCAHWRTSEVEHSR